MLGRRLILLACTLVAAGLFYGLYWIAPQVMLIQANAREIPIEERFAVDLDAFDSEPTRFETEAEGEDTSPSDETLREMLNRETTLMPEEDPEPLEPVEIPELEDRLDNNALEREHDFELDENVLRGIDAQILEIAETDARKDIDVVRQLVKPSSDRILAKDERPTFRGSEDGVGVGAPVQLEQTVDIMDRLMDALDEAGAEAEDGTPEFDVMTLEEQLAFSPEALEPESAFALEEMRLAGSHAQREVVTESRFGSMDNLVGIAVRTYVDPQSQQGYFELMISPDADQAIPVLPKDVTFVIDASNSIIQRKLTLTARGVRDCLSILRPDDHFNIIVFRDSPTLFSPERRPATPEALQAAREFLDGLESFGSTDVYSAIMPVIQQPPRSGVPGIIFVITDGRPTEGNLEGRALINALSDENTHGNTIYTLGGGNTVNQYLLDLLAYRNRGRSHVFPDLGEIDGRLPRFFSQLSDAYLVDLDADFGRIDASQVYPRALPDFYKGQVVTLYGRYNPETEGNLVVRLDGRAGDEAREMVLTADLGTAPQGGPEIARQWAFEKTYHLIGEVSRLGETPELMGEIRRLSREYGVRSSYAEN